ncbi:uncharacterized protein LOC131605759 [Vicia villosa]|uniref:uncharacterized protein LOC131605759 n=1 Tax=Vicia villosa TaxID=3911 RepID=UPI00273C9460|nr:uncharacterized protein LOC131605759 [Vicia villosa]
MKYLKPYSCILALPEFPSAILGRLGYPHLHGMTASTCGDLEIHVGGVGIAATDTFTGPLISSGVLVEKVEEVREEVFNHFSNKFKEEDLDRLALDGVDFKSISSVERDSLESHFQEKEVKEAIWSCGSSKSPGPDVGCMYKVISKILAGRLKCVLHSIISTCQSAFVPDRYLLDGVLVANELVDYAKKEGHSCLFFKVDFEKAYDNVSWNFLRYMLNRMGFGPKWKTWMELLIFNSSMSVLVNGSPTKEFEVEKGLRQGDPLSPFLFVIVAEGLAGLVRKSSDIGAFNGMGINGSRPVDILQFADDTLLVGEGSWRQVWAIKVVLKAFELASGLGINYHKSKLIGINLTNNFLEAASYVLSCRVEESKFVFLGIVIGCNPRSFSSWTHLLAKMKKRLSGWKNRFLSLGGRITLLKSILGSLYIFTMSFYKIPVCVAKEFTRMQSNFLWGGVMDDNKRRIHWISWKDVCLPLDKGGLGIKNILTFNAALLKKWRWRILEGRNSVWYNILKARYGDISMKSFGGGMFPSSLPSPSSSSFSIWWKDLMSVGKEEYNDPIASLCRFKIGNGFSTPFWEARWCGEFSLKDKFPVLYSASSLKMVSVAGMGGWINGCWKWGGCGINSFLLSEPSFSLVFDSFRNYMEEFVVDIERKDEIGWDLTADGSFSVASCYNFYAENFIPFGPPNRYDNVLALVWKMEVPFKIKAFGWRLLINRLPTKDQLVHRKIALSLDNSLCGFCGTNPESRDHVFFGCKSVELVWREVAVWIGKEVGDLDVDCFSSFSDWSLFCKKKKVKGGKIGVVWLATVWSLWLTRNGICFRNEIWNVNNTVWSIKSLVWKWSFIGEITHSICSFYEFIKEPLLYLS